MPRHSDANAQHVDSKPRRKLEDQRRMQFRRAIEDHCEELRLRQELADYPDLVAAAYLSSNRQGRRSAQRAG
ncbi:PA3496 family putative envelope integrity protein [Pseudomonas aeruginosa]|uniref:PA3496 family putative envelope integrity protein n=1 Tax=Pseudomonas aeruginosa TaxID=287 RepID=UPI000EAC5ABE|nr:transcriptional regulator [Pseudomonas aeruginosa]